MSKTYNINKIGDKEYTLSKVFSEKMKKRGATFIATKRKNMMKGDEEQGLLQVPF